MTKITKSLPVKSKRPYLYLAGPMRGIADFNFPAFNSAAAILRNQGFRVFSPAENDSKKHGNIFKTKTGDESALAATTGWTINKALEDDTRFICRHATGIAMLPGWRRSKGARAELALAKALGLTVIFLRRSTLEKVYA